ncbi:uncharacterized protein UMAG_04098 [Mycosarcoma maydis]|uniref:Uncharacterized protein n=1 Tax=Mycosarcoma maydis TaxID=5270 RepID=A0A0D1DV61_MYCMD|nr:uncharacterized protein UMAG_04098 [Ustilago maydis 521]KIS67596.1 hypothetical protein UMAG_04098 [Ustilago maydis 521]|eukprot:XP_011390606.1 hypothetical protein UMAG_04098 [Ustilago maydis 521]
MDQHKRGKMQDALRSWFILTQRCKLLGVTIESISHQAACAELQQLVAEADASDNPASSAAGLYKRKQRLKRWAGCAPARFKLSRRSQNGAVTAAFVDAQDAAGRRSSRVAADGSAAHESREMPIHPASGLSKMDGDAACTTVVSVEDLSRLTHLRADDIVLALHESELVDPARTPYLHTTDQIVTVLLFLQPAGRRHVLILF